MQNRREFIRSAAALTGGAFALGSIPDAIARAMSIEPAPGTTFRDAEHVVILMQENRSFDHAYGALRGVRGFRDPRAHVQPNGNRVWFQTDAEGHTYAPFRLDMTHSKATWIGGLPHTWPDQVDARNGGRYDNWLIAKPKRDLPFTLGHYTRADLPFYYAFADAFTVCDQAFCSSLTGTTANRLFLWTGNIRRDATDVPRVMNADTVYDKEASWHTFPERLEEAGVSWKIYQNEITYDNGLSKEEDAWLSSFGDNPLEWFTQYNIRFAKSRRAFVPKFLATAPAEIAKHEAALQSPELTGRARERTQQELDGLRKALIAAKDEQTRYTDESWNALSARTKALHDKAFTTNINHVPYRALAHIEYDDNGVSRQVSVPAGDVLYQLRHDVAKDTLPAVSWIVAPENFSDHPASAWYGAWYVSEVLDALTKNPDVWKKTILILCYDENDGYFDHVPPFVAPHPTRTDTGRASVGIDTTVDWASVYEREHAIGLGFRVPLVIASPWSRGGAVNSQVFDHTSVLMFVEKWLSGKGKYVKETNISDWRRVVCGDLTSAFREYDGSHIELPKPLDRDATVERIWSAQFQPPPTGGASLTKDAIATTNVGTLQEAGTRPACALPYELVVNGVANNRSFKLTMEARVDAFGKSAQGGAFNAYSYGEPFHARSYAVRAGDTVRDDLAISSAYHVRVDGPNGFMREFRGDASVGLDVSVDFAKRHAKDGVLEITIANATSASRAVTIHDESYGAPVQQVIAAAGGRSSIAIDTSSAHGWYDFSVRSSGQVYRYAGRVETGKWSVSDPAMGRA
ncbi:MAG TPA: phospholipase C, phosphocholine-specific [Gemmatimonadaceae bacterium]|jgi:phospholipase C